MRPAHSTAVLFNLLVAGLGLSGCAISTPGSQAPAQGQADCAAAAARRFHVPVDSIQVLGSQVGTSATLYQVDLRHAPSGRQAKCTVDQNGTVTGVVEVR
ncbi:hypothetical protein [Variovorax sp.]|uniref:hypothetical protein n=1 Tax=Variovorax sp. TaxID=1871043 RepID=UPI002D521472|nr:hypothetical protein [Variovorax sp.]HYP86174.1 hypothetical protein [Variovorax sp.]